MSRTTQSCITMTYQTRWEGRDGDVPVGKDSCRKNGVGYRLRSHLISSDQRIGSGVSRMIGMSLNHGRLLLTVSSCRKGRVLGCNLFIISDFACGNTNSFGACQPVAMIVVGVFVVMVFGGAIRVSALIFGYISVMIANVYDFAGKVVIFEDKLSEIALVVIFKGVGIITAAPCNKMSFTVVCVECGILIYFFFHNDAAQFVAL